MVTAAGYKVGIAQDDNHIRLRGRPQAMKHANQALYEKAVVDALLNSLTARRAGS
ncbi:hypothetical protein [Streptomyces sp. NBC_00582]|uniref:hypothetical protein n=1 Tax=Streptomyces sp. NBC_00582 TaxID=2975783 RepID=UPI002E80F56F|nr:hypothetical protein [Streptomyces sp. NBC_00582]WUB60724.1 hypothetical protein OG852_10180 [Streptomyces sp. NBC_00582]